MSDNTYWDFRVRKVTRIVDGDTYDLEIDLGFRQYGVYRFRLADVDTPEIYGVSKDSEEYERGIRASRFVAEWFGNRFPETTIWVRSYKEQTFNRWVAEIYTEDGDNLGEAIVNAGYDASTS